MWDGIERRKGARVPDNFTPNGAFEGYVAAKLETIAERLDKLPCPESFKRIGKCENDIANIKGKATVLGIVFGAVSGFITKWIFGK